MKPFERAGQPLPFLLFLALYASFGLLSLNHAPGFDEAVHAVDAVAYTDYLAGNLGANPSSFAEGFYARYPLLHIGYYPPLYELTAAFAMAFANAIQTAYFVTLLHALSTLVFFYLLLGLFVDKKASLLGTALLGFSPFFLKYGTMAMLEVPQLLFAVASAYFFFRALRGGQKWVYYAAAFSFGLGLLVRWQMAVLLPVFIYEAWKNKQVKNFLKPAIAGALIALPYYAFLLLTPVLRNHLFLYLFSAPAEDIAANPGLFSLGRWLYYPSALFSQLSPFVAAAALAALAWSVWKRKNLFFAAWIGAVYLVMSKTITIVPWYTMLWMPAFVFILVRSIKEATSKYAHYVLAALLLSQLFFVFQTPYQQLSPDYGRAAEWAIANAGGNESVFFIGDYGTFIAEAAVRDTGRRLVVTKLLICRFEGNMTTDEFTGMLEESSVRIVMRDGNYAGYARGKEIADFIEGSGRFQKMADFGSISAYEYEDFKPRQNNTVCVRSCTSPTICADL